MSVSNIILETGTNISGAFRQASSEDLKQYSSAINVQIHHPKQLHIHIFIA
jgi:hypothetical protein